MIFSVIALFAVATVIWSTFHAIKGNHRLYWISATGIYVFSFITGFSIGQLTVAFTLIPLILAIGYSFGWIKSKVHAVILLCLGVVTSGLVVVFDVGNWLFLPFAFLIS
ncbi:hypothetical protein JSQ81_11280 [Sporosarcina sp. Marseille-Q4063]|uniref:hypothetical protein n=1 Tax=Sporosarcina sp. Marseille-Q4063 TaxID=2810514 RepID=UPI001BB061C2|nr:hypothetical protein [Sporosarcina sp. Marseille-Q4063]QUW20444.1 hypothetical protein JSQ81_11280 [Sporosarcina sp. Marseille-Q4063]